MNEYIREEELGKKLNVCRGTLRSWRKQGLPFRCICRLILYSPEEVEAWLREHCQGQNENETKSEGVSL
jgi:hypothetical protein